MCGATAMLLSFTYSVSYIFMNGIVKKRESCVIVKNGDYSVLRLLFADDFAPLESTQNSLRKARIRFLIACSIAGTKIRTGTMKTNHVPVRATKAVFSPSWWSITKTVREIQVPRHLIHKRSQTKQRIEYEQVQ